MKNLAIILVAVIVTALATGYFYRAKTDPSEVINEKGEVVLNEEPTKAPAPLPDLPEAEPDTLYGLITIIDWSNFRPQTDGKVNLQNRIGAATVLRTAGVVKTKNFYTMKLTEDKKDFEWIMIPAENVAEFYVWPESKR
jgi:hypothetical protein